MRRIPVFLILATFSVVGSVFGAISPAWAAPAPGTVFVQDCQQRISGKGVPIVICAINRWGIGTPQLWVSYGGSAARAYVKLNGRDGIFSLATFADRSLRLNQPRRVHQCYAPDMNGFVPDEGSGTFPRCPRQVPPLPQATLVWYAEKPPAAETSLFFYAFDRSGRPNVWDVEVAFVNARGEWDSDLGRNYQFRFDAMP